MRSVTARTFCIGVMHVSACNVLCYFSKLNAVNNSFAVKRVLLYATELWDLWHLKMCVYPGEKEFVEYVVSKRMYSAIF